MSNYTCLHATSGVSTSNRSNVTSDPLTLVLTTLSWAWLYLGLSLSYSELASDPHISLSLGLPTHLYRVTSREKPRLLLLYLHTLVFLVNMLEYKVDDHALYKVFRSIIDPTLDLPRHSPCSNHWHFGRWTITVKVTRSRVQILWKNIRWLTEDNIHFI